MLLQCEKCLKRYDDEHCWTICPHNPIYRPHDAVLCRQHDFFRPCQICLDPSIGEVPSKWYNLHTGELSSRNIIIHLTAQLSVPSEISYSFEKQEWKEHL
jgi:hypothetical protein